RKVKFVESLGGSLIHQRAIDPAIQEHLLPEDDVHTLRMSNTILGNGFVEVIPDRQLLKVKKGQRRFGMEGFAVVVPVAVAAKKDADGNDTFVLVERLGRFAGRCQVVWFVISSAGA